jgi:hypothetical protein
VAGVGDAQYCQGSDRALLTVGLKYSYQPLVVVAGKMREWPVTHRSFASVRHADVHFSGV